MLLWYRFSLSRLTKKIKREKMKWLTGFKLIKHKPVRSVINYVNNWGSLIISICAMECVDERVNKIVGHAGWCENWLVSKDINTNFQL